MNPVVRPGGGRAKIVIKTKVVQKSTVCQYVRMLRYQNASCSECHQDVRPSVCHVMSVMYVMSNEYVYMAVFQYVNMSVCNFSAKVSKRKLLTI